MFLDFASHDLAQYRALSYVQPGLIRGETSLMAALFFQDILSGYAESRLTFPDISL